MTDAIIALPRDAQWVGAAVAEGGSAPYRDLGFRAGPAVDVTVTSPPPPGSAVAVALAAGAKVVGVPLLAGSTEQLLAAVEAAGDGTPLRRLLAALRRGDALLGTALLPVHDASDHDPGTGGPATMVRLASALRPFLAARGVTGEEADALLAPGGAVGGLPRRMERLGDDMLLLPRDAFTHPAWLSPPLAGDAPSPVEASLEAPAPQPGVAAFSAPIWDVLCALVRGVTRVARQTEIDAGATRDSRLVLLRGARVDGAYDLPQPEAPTAAAPAAASVAAPDFAHRQPSAPPPAPATAAILSEPVPALRQRGAPLRASKPPPAAPAIDLRHGSWVAVREGGIVYAFDAGRTMFSSGNVSEKARVGALPARGEVVVDMYAGIGYWTLPLLLRAGAAHVHAADWNPHAVRTLRANLAANGVPPGRVTLWPGDNAQLVVGSPVEGAADRVVLGLIPTSERGWPVAVRCLKPATGGWLHVHANASDAELAGGAWLTGLTGRLAALAAAAGRGHWDVVARHVERVKSYAPHVWHVVVDVECRPRAA